MKDWSKGMVSGEEHYGKDDEIRTVVRILDRKNRHEEGSYYEHITDTDTGRIIRSVSERFVDHQGRGSAKKAIPDFSDEWVAVAAYYIWQEQGCPHGRHNNHWNLAKNRLKKMFREGKLDVWRCLRMINQ